MGVCVLVYKCVCARYIPLSFTVWQFEYVCSLVIKAEPETTQLLPTGLEMHIRQTTPHGEMPACLVPLASMTVYGTSPVCPAKHKKAGGSSVDDHWGSQGRENNLLASK